MSATTEIRFLSLFVPDLDAAATRYEAVLGIAPQANSAEAPRPHPFALRGPIVFQLGAVALALYECDGRTTHPGDVGIGLVAEAGPEELAKRATANGGRVFYGPRVLPEDGRACAAFMLPDRHFFETLGR